MAMIEWDRLMETCIKRQCNDAVLAPGSPPLLRVGGGLAPLMVEALSATELVQMVESIRNPPAARAAGESYEYKAHDGYSYMDIEFRKGYAFRITVFGAQTPSFVLVTRLFPENASEERLLR